MIALAAVTIFLPLSLTSCRRDPDVLKRKYLDGGNRYFQRGKYREALIMYRSALKLDTKLGDAYYRAGLTEIKLHSMDKALLALRRAVELLPEGPDRDDSRVKLADIIVGYLKNVTFDAQVIEEADRLTNDVLLQNRNLYDGHRLKGVVSLIRFAHFGALRPEQGRKDLDLALAELQAANQINPYQPDVLEPLFRGLAQAGLGKQGEDLLLQAIEHDRTDLTPYQELRQYYALTGRFDDLRRILETAIHNNPKESSFLLDLAGYYRAVGKPLEGSKVIDGMTSRLQDFPNAFEVAGDFYANSGQPEEAIRQYEKGIAAFPSGKLTYDTRIVGACMAWGRLADAERVNDAILKDYPNDVEALVRRAAMLSGKGDVKGSIQELEKTLRIAPTNPDAHYHLGRALMTDKQPERARYEFSEALKGSPRNNAARLALAQIELDAGEYGRVVTAMDDALVYQPKDPAVRLTRAIGLRGMKKYDEARVELNGLLAEYPKYEDALFQLGLLDESLGRWKEAEAGYQKLYEVNPANTRGLMALAQANVAQNQVEKAFQILETEAAKRPERNDIHLALARVALLAGHDERAISEFKMLLQRLQNDSPALADVQVLLGEYYLKRKDFQTALGYLETARKLHPDNSMVLHGLGSAYDNLGRKEEARQVYEASLKLNGDNAIVLNNLANLMAETGVDLDRALTLAQRARQKLPDQLDVSDTIGLIYFKKSLTENALEIFEDLVRKKPLEPMFRYHLALALLQKGDRARARQELRTALASHPSANDASKIQEQLAKIGA